LILGFLGYGYSPSKSAFFVFSSSSVSAFGPDNDDDPKKVMDTLFESAVNAAIIATALAGSGMIVGF